MLSRQVTSLLRSSNLNPVYGEEILSDILNRLADTDKRLDEAHPIFLQLVNLQENLNYVGQQLTTLFRELKTLRLSLLVQSLRLDVPTTESLVLREIGNWHILAPTVTIKKNAGKTPMGERDYSVTNMLTV